MKGRTESAGEISPELAEDSLHQSYGKYKLVSRTKGQILLTASSAPDIPLIPHHALLAQYSQFEKLSSTKSEFKCKLVSQSK